MFQNIVSYCSDFMDNKVALKFNVSEYCCYCSDFMDNKVVLKFNVSEYCCYCSDFMDNKVVLKFNVSEYCCYCSDFMDNKVVLKFRVSEYCCYCSDFSWSHPLCCLDHPTPSCSHPRHPAALAAWNTSIGATPVHCPAELPPWPCPGSSCCPSPLLWPCLFIVAIAQSSSQTSRLSVEREVVHCHEGIPFFFLFCLCFAGSLLWSSSV